MKRKIISITGTRSDYGLMYPVFEKISQNKELELHLIITGMHLLPEFKSSLQKVYSDHVCKLYKTNMLFGEDSETSMAQSLGVALMNLAGLFDEIKPDIVLLQGDRGEMLAGAIAAAHMNIPIIHMSGGDYSGTIDDSIRNAISKFSHLHLTTCLSSTERLLKMGETPNRIFQVGEPGLDTIQKMKYLDSNELAKDLNLDLNKPVILAAQHPVTTEASEAAFQIKQTLEALKELNFQTVFTYPNSDAGGREMTAVLESYKNNDFIRIIPNLGSQKYLSLLKITSVLVGNSSSGIWEAPSFKTPVVNIGTRQYGRLRANNVIDVDYNKEQIQKAILYVMNDKKYRENLKNCKNPYGDGKTSEKTVSILHGLIISPELISKWLPCSKSFLKEGLDAV